MIGGLIPPLHQTQLNRLAPENYLRVFMGGLRKKVEAAPSQPRHFITETGVGYRFIP
jgi:DNA-binding response OmpR family regulator